MGAIAVKGTYRNGIIELHEPVEATDGAPVTVLFQEQPVALAPPLWAMIQQRVEQQVADLPELTDEEFDKIGRKMTFGDAVVLQAAEAYRVTAIITWNPKHFAERTAIPVWTPAEWLAQQNGGVSHDH